MTETLSHDMLDSGVGGKYYFNDTYDPKNPVYQVIGFNILGRGDKQTTAVAICVHYPEGYEGDFSLNNRLDDRRATRDELKVVLDKAIEMKEQKKRAQQETFVNFRDYSSG